MIHMRYYLALSIIIILSIGCQSNLKKSLTSSNFEIGILTDCQYCNCETRGSRFYQNSPNKLRAAVAELNKKDLEFTVHLGDFIDRNFNSYDSVLPIWRELRSKKYHILGNHDFAVEDSLKSQVLKKLDLKNRYYSFTKNNWRFIILDGNDLSFHGAISDIKKRQTDSIYNLLLKDSLPYMQKWNGALSKQQLKWVGSELEKATENDENVVFFCHFPVYPLASDNLWNRNELIELIDKYPCVKFYINGHNHAGAYEEENNVHYLTFSGMVETDQTNSFATVLFTNDSIHVAGYGRGISRKLKIN